MTEFPGRWPLPEQKIIQGRYCRLEPLNSQSHGDQLFEAIAGPEAERLHRWLADPVPKSRADFDTWLLPKVASDDPLYFAVINQETGRVEGRQTLMDINTSFGSAEIGHILWGPNIAGTRVTTEAFFLFANVMFSLGYRRYQWRCNANNEPSRRAAQRFGYTFEGIFRNHMIVKGESRDTAWYSILDTEWPRLKAGFEEWLRPENFDASGQQKYKLTFSDLCV
jgi:RimJ/RimL family protein N-acetyltransferase